MLTKPPRLGKEISRLSGGLRGPLISSHGHNLDENATMHLRNQGVDVQCSLHLDVFRRLRLAHRLARSAAPPVIDSEVA